LRSRFYGRDQYRSDPVHRLQGDRLIRRNAGVPVALASGYIQESGTISSTGNTIAGISQQAGDNLASAGAAPVGGSGLTYGKVPNQTSAVNIPIGAPMADGNTGVFIACDNTIFQGVTDGAHTNAVTDVGSIFGLTKDSTTGNWFVDTTITTAGGGACAEVTELIDAAGIGAFGVGTTGGRVAFKIARVNQQMFT
jgi:hypothetical protein